MNKSAVAALAKIASPTVGAIVIGLDEVSILAAIQMGVSNGRLESLNNKIGCSNTAPMAFTPPQPLSR